MKFKIEIWDIMKLEELYSTHKIELSPPYQRNSIWSLKAQKLLIDTIKRELPLPNFFLQKKGDGFEISRRAIQQL